MGTDSINIFTQSRSSMLPISLNLMPVLMVSRCRTVMSRAHLLEEGGSSVKMSSSRRSRSISPSSYAKPMAVDTMLLLAEYSMWGRFGLYGAQYPSANTFPSLISIMACTPRVSTSFSTARKSCSATALLMPASSGVQRGRG